MLLDERQENYGVAKATALTDFLQGAVPLARALGFRVVEFTPERTVCSIPITEAAMNQNRTFQAATFYILADYAVGMALYAALPGFTLQGQAIDPGTVPIIGWLKDGYVKHLKPATGEIRAEVSIPLEARLKIREDLANTGRAACQGEAMIYQGDTLVAFARHTVVFKTLAN